MAPPARRARLGTLHSVIEDLLAAREGGGIDRADETWFLGIRAALRARLTEEEASLTEAVALARLHIARECNRVRQQAQEDPGKIAASRSTQLLLLRDVTSTEKHSAVRRRVLREAGGDLSPDALRKREEVIIKRIATAMLDEVERSHWPTRRVSTIEELVMDTSTHFKVLADLIKVHAQGIYPRDAVEIEYPRLIKGLAQILYRIGELQWLAKSARDLAAKSQVRSPVQVMLTDALFNLASKPLNNHQDRITVADLYQHHRADRVAFETSIINREQDELLEAAFAWLASCTSTCAFERTFIRGLLYPVHSMVASLRDMAYHVEQLASGKLQMEVRADDAVLQHIHDSVQS